MATVYAEDLEDAVLMVSEPGTTDAAWVSLDTGQVHVRSALVETQAPLPGNIDSSERYVPVPHMRTLALGLELVFDFADAAMEDDADRVREMFRRPDGYRDFSTLVEERGLEERWHDFREAQTRAVLAAWCAQHGLELG
ncbi:hypothetical protein G4G28_20030 [Massilia sp. Dwa41.01b]|uniref:hypothetical protein n=1 Tax=unclassified Massilia TaxID=2609279 RepID=UPI001601C35C|nr:MULTISPECIES: hypothetical protein [unclassified Massilia]QNA90216.1 hypothetical protein G4G28_20030 [Massilia sp. Dwa41.01b]QNB01103.1 hypothetical protein G4G31_23630 [Massilia sp. Se16.2.3]